MARENGGSKKARLTKNQKRRQRKKAEKQQAKDEVPAERPEKTPEDAEELPEVEYVSSDLSRDLAAVAQAAETEESQLAEAFQAVFARFAAPGADAAGDAAKPEAPEAPAADVTEAQVDDIDALLDAEEAKAEGLSRKAHKKLSRLTVAELKQLVARPDVVEAHDATASDPRLLVFLKAHRNSVPVPRHWSEKRKYLQGKRGFEKPAWALPDFLAKTGIGEIRDASANAEATAKQKARARTKPKMGKLDVDYQVLHDAFFKYQTKPRLSLPGDLYYEGRELEQQHRDFRVGHLTEALREALEMGPGSPPPWLINMQRYGPPPAYPSMRIPGLNAPIPEGASFGYHAGGWGKPPVDPDGNPLYGDVFGVAPETQRDSGVGKGPKVLFGAYEAVEEEEDEEDEEDESDESDEEEGKTTSLDDIDDDESGVSSIVSGLNTPGHFDLRKDAGEAAPPKELYQVLSTESTRVGGALFGSERRYAIPGQTERTVEVTLNAEDLEGQLADPGALQERYEEAVTAKRKQSGREDVAELVAENSAKRARKMEKDKATKQKVKDFRF